MITETIQAEEHIIHQYTKDWKSIKERFLKFMYHETDIEWKLEKKWDETYWITKADIKDINDINDKTDETDETNSENIPKETGIWFESEPIAGTKKRGNK